MFNKRWTHRLVMLLAVIACSGVYARAQDGAVTADQAVFVANNVWMMVSTFLVFIMHLGFATLESGLVQAKNTVNILFKNVMIVSIGLLTYAAWGFNLMYPGDFNIIGGGGGILGFAGPWLSMPEGADGLIGYADGGYTYWTDFLFQGMFAATGATIVSGAVAGRIKMPSFLIFTFFFVGFVYPAVGSWKWGAGWLDQMGFYDFAGSTLVHSVGGWGALAGVLLLGPRLGKYVGGEVRAIPGSNMPLATIGVFLLWMGWFGFNGGSVLSADPELTSLALVTTCLAAAGGILAAYITSSVMQSKPDLTMALNGALAGLVGITASADVVSPMSAVIIGLVAGVLVVISVITIDGTLKLDDPVGAISVHLVCGIWGTLAVGIFGQGDFSIGTQLVGIAAYGVVTFIAALVIFGIIKAVLGIRVSEDEELKGLDIGEHAMEAYPGFQNFITQ